MNKIFLLVCVIVTALVFSGCSSTSSSTTTNTTTTATTRTETQATTTRVTVTLSESAITLTTYSLMTDVLVKDVSIRLSDDEDTILIAIQVNAATNLDHAKSIVETAVRQIGLFADGESPGKNYLGEIWENYSGLICIFSGTETVIVDATVAPNSNIIIYHEP